MKGQLSFIEPEFIRDSDCSVLTPVKLGKPDEPAYGMGKHISPRIAGRTGSSHFERIYFRAARTARPVTINCWRWGFQKEK